MNKTSTLSTIAFIYVVANLVLISSGFVTPEREPSRLYNLEELRAKKVYYSLEEALSEPERVYKLSLYDNALLILPQAIKQFKNLQVLDISNNYITEIPAYIGELHQLQYLIIEDNQITALPPEIANLHNLKVLNLRKNHITEIPKHIASLESLQELYLEYNHIENVSKEFSFLSNLRVLNLQNNSLKEFPEAVCKLKNLEKLNVRQNAITSYPKEIAELKNIVHFDFDLTKLALKESQKLGRYMITTNTRIGRVALQTAPFFEKEIFENSDVEVLSTFPLETPNTYMSKVRLQQNENRENVRMVDVIWMLNDSDLELINVVEDLKAFNLPAAVPMD